MEAKHFTASVITSRGRAELIRNATRRILCYAPGLGVEEVRALLSALERLPAGAVRVLIDTDIPAFTCGYWGSTDPELLKRLVQKTEAKVAKGVRLGLLVADDECYIYSPTPQSLEPEGSSSSEANALRLDAEETERLMRSITTATPDKRPIVTE